MTSTIKVNTIQNTCGADIIKESGNTITLGASGDTITLASGASQTGFGRTGTVNWQTTPKTAATFTAANGEGYFVDTTSNAITMTMPSGSAGAIVSIQDYNKTFDDNNFTVAPATGEKINGGDASANLIISTEGQGLTFVYVDGTVGWKTVHENEFTKGGSNFIAASGGTETTSGDCKIHTFTGPGPFTVTTTSGCAAHNTLSYVVVGGGGGGGNWGGGGAGAGGYREVKSPSTPYTASPLDGYPSSPNRISAASQAYPITIGAGGTAPPAYPNRNTCISNGSNSIFSTITGAGGGKGGNQGASGGDGGSGGGQSVTCASAGSGNTPPTTPAQGTNGGTGHSNPPIGAYFGGGGGGATAAGANDPGSNDAGPGGAGATSSITGSPVARAGGGGGGNVDTGCSTGGAGGGGAGGGGDAGGAGTAGTANTGGGGGAAGASSPSGSAAGAAGAGGSGVVIIRYKFQ